MRSAASENVEFHESAHIRLEFVWLSGILFFFKATCRISELEEGGTQSPPEGNPRSEAVLPSCFCIDLCPHQRAQPKHSCTTFDPSKIYDHQQR